MQVMSPPPMAPISAFDSRGAQSARLGSGNGGGRIR
jgi:hypothetical protein